MTEQAKNLSDYLMLTMWLEETGRPGVCTRTEQAKNLSEYLMLTMWLEKTAATKEVAQHCRESIRGLSACLPKSQVNECKREMKRRMATPGQSPIIVWRDGSGGTVRMDVHVARAAVLHAASGLQRPYDLVLGFAAYCLLKVVDDPLTGQAARQYYDAIRSKTETDVLAGPLGREWLARHKAAEVLNDRERRKADDQICREMCPVLEVMARQADDAVSVELAMRTAAAMGTLKFPGEVHLQQSAAARRS